MGFKLMLETYKTIIMRLVTMLIILIFLTCNAEEATSLVLSKPIPSEDTTDSMVTGFYYKQIWQDFDFEESPRIADTQKLANEYRDFIRTIRDTIFQSNTVPVDSVVVSVYSDCLGSKAFNDSLTQAIADQIKVAIWPYISGIKIDSSKLKFRGYGERELMNICWCEDGKGHKDYCDEEEHARNRRAVICYYYRKPVNKD